MDLFLFGGKELLILALGFMVITIASNRIAISFKRIKLPFITGFLISGIICGPYFLGLIPETSISRLNFINEMALAFIAFAAGSELYLRELRSRFNSIKWNAIGQLTSTFVVGGLPGELLAEFVERYGSNKHASIFLKLMDAICSVDFLEFDAVLVKKCTSLIKREMAIVENIL